MRECKIDLVAEHGRRLSLGSRLADTFLSSPYPGVACGRAFTGKAFFLHYSALSRVKADFHDDGKCRCDFHYNNCL